MLARFVHGIYLNGADVYCIKNPSNFSNTVGGTKICTIAKSYGWIKEFSVPTVNGFEYALLPSVFGGSGSTYVCDECYLTEINGDALCAGGSVSRKQESGPFHIMLVKSSSLSDTGARIQELP